jgi:hypothetical protein
MLPQAGREDVETLRGMEASRELGLLNCVVSLRKNQPSA